jgi:hypothetical protein
VLEQVREPGLPRGSFFDPTWIPDVEVHHRRFGVFVDDQGEPVLQHVLRERDVDLQVR